LLTATPSHYRTPPLINQLHSGRRRDRAASETIVRETLPASDLQLRCCKGSGVTVAVYTPMSRFRLFPKRFRLRAALPVEIGPRPRSWKHLKSRPLVVPLTGIYAGWIAVSISLL
jgi:hypothetical protein